MKPRQDAIAGFYKKWIQRSFPRISLTMLFFIAAQFACWAVHDATQEWLFRKAGYTFGAFMAFMLQACCIVGSAAEIAFSRTQQHQQEQLAAKRKSLSDPEIAEPRREIVSEQESATYNTWREVAQSVPAHYALLGLVIALSNGLATAALAYVSQPVKVLFKSSKLVPVMAFRAAMGNAPGGNSWREYIYAFCVCAGIAVFTMADQASSSQVKAHVLGLAMLTGSVCADAIAPNLQERLLRKHHQPKASLMLHTNWISAAMTLFFLVPSGEGYSAVLWLWAHPTPARVLVMQSVAGALGVAAYVGCIQYAGSKTTVLVTSTRKMFTIAISFIFISKAAFTGMHFVGLLLAVTGIMGSGLEEADAKGGAKKPAGIGEKGPQQGAAGGGAAHHHHHGSSSSGVRDPHAHSPGIQHHGGAAQRGDWEKEMVEVASIPHHHEHALHHSGYYEKTDPLRNT